MSVFLVFLDTRDRKKLNSGVRVRSFSETLELVKFKLAIFLNQELVKFKLAKFQKIKS